MLPQYLPHFPFSHAIFANNLKELCFLYIIICFFITRIVILKWSFKMIIAKLCVCGVHHGYNLGTYKIHNIMDKWFGHRTTSIYDTAFPISCTNKSYFQILLRISSRDKPFTGRVFGRRKAVRTRSSSARRRSAAASSTHSAAMH